MADQEVLIRIGMSENPDQDIGDQCKQQSDRDENEYLFVL